MPRLRRSTPLAPGSLEVDAVSCFRWSAGGDGLDSMLGESCYRTEQEARRAWERARRACWAQEHRFRLPGPAERFDALTLDSRDVVYWQWNATTFDLPHALDVLADDRANLARFRTTRAAKGITDFLDVLDQDLDEIERTARELAAHPGRPWERGYPHHLNTADTYGAAIARLTPREHRCTSDRRRQTNAGNNE